MNKGKLSLVVLYACIAVLVHAQEDLIERDVYEKKSLRAEAEETLSKGGRNLFSLPSWISCSHCSHPGKFRTNKWDIQNNEMVRHCGNINGVATSTRSCGIIKGAEIDFTHLSIGAAASCIACNLACGSCAKATATAYLSSKLKASSIIFATELAKVGEGVLLDIIEEAVTDLLNGKSVSKAIGEWDLHLSAGVWTFTGQTCNGICWQNSAPKTRPFIRYKIEKKNQRENVQIRLRDSQHCLDSPTRSNLGKVHLWSCSGSNPNQRWDIEGTQIKLRGTNLCLDNLFNHAVNGNQLVVYPCHGGVAQRWDIQDINGISEIRNSDYNNMCIDVHLGQTNNGQKVQLWQCLNNQNQKFSVRT